MPAGARRATGALQIEVAPPGPYRLGSGRWPDAVARTRDGVYERFLHVDGRPVLIRAWELRRERRVAIAALPAPAEWLRAPGREGGDGRPGRASPHRSGGRSRSGRRGRADMSLQAGDRTAAKRHGAGPADEGEIEPAHREDLEIAIARARSALAVDDDLSPFHAEFKRDPLLGPLIRDRPWLRVRRAAQPWEALAWTITEQLIEAYRAASIQRRIVASWGRAIELPGVAARPLADVPGPAAIAARAPAELAALDLAPKRALTLLEAAREVAAGRCRPERPADDRRLLAISGIGAWTIQSLALRGRGDLDALPAGDLAYLKLVGHLARLGRRATIAEVEEYFAPYAPWRALAGRHALAGHRRELAAAPPLRYHPPAPEYEAA